ncbi:NAD(P)H-dependent oxidoreductase [Allobaculum sp. Allo2]|nr:NAD(P)H-dependent oxidoreductase [Allobaculum sp. Allo2]
MSVDAYPARAFSHAIIEDRRNFFLESEEFQHENSAHLRIPSQYIVQHGTRSGRQKGAGGYGHQSQHPSLWRSSLFNQDLEAPELESVSRIRQEIREADGLWFFTPEYNGMITGVLKNLLDWMSRPTAPDYTRASSVLYGKSAAISGAGGRMAAKGSREQLAILLKRLGVKVCPEEYGLALTPEEFSTDSFTDPDGVADAIASQAREFIVWLKG